jgi:replication factor C subunit 3/5
MEHVPWVEKYRPVQFESIILDEKNKIILENMLKNKMVPNLIFYGPPGTGKTTTIINLINKFQRMYNERYKELIIHLNASDDRGIETIRNQIYTFTKSSHLFNQGTKFIILDEIDYMTKPAQNSLYNLIKEKIPNVRFCLICNYISKINKSLQNTCMLFKFNSLPKKCIHSYLSDIAKKESISNIIKKNDIDNIIVKFKSDIRSMINYMQGLTSRSVKQKILSKTEINALIDTFIKRPIKTSEKKFIDYLYLYNIEKSELVLQIFYHIIENNNFIKKDIIYFMKSILHNNIYYCNDFNKFFISKLVSLLSV